MTGFPRCSHILLKPVQVNSTQDTFYGFLKCDRIWENPSCSEFYEILVSCIFDKLDPRANLSPSLRPIARFA